LTIRECRSYSCAPFATRENPKAPPEIDPTVYFLPMGTKAFDGISAMVYLSYLTGQPIELASHNIDAAGRTVVAERRSRLARDPMAARDGGEIKAIALGAR